MTILIVEDDENKRFQLRQFITREFPSTSVEVQRSLQSGLKHIRQQPPQGILLDMTLPTYDAGPDESGGQTNIFGGREFLRQMDRFDIEIPVIVVTQFETFGKGRHIVGLTELDGELRVDHPRVYHGCVYYHAAIHGWEEKLRSLLATILSPA